MRAGNSGLVAVAFAVLLLVFAGPAAAQSTITGRVVDDATGQPINLAAVSAAGRAVPTNQQGSFTLSVPPGRHTVTVSVIGYQDGTAVVNVAPGASATVEIRLTQTALLLNPLTVTATRQQSQRSISAPAAVNVATAEDLEVLAPTTPVDYVKAMPGVDVVQTGITQSNTVARGFNNVFSGALLVLTDNRYARIPSLRLNAYNMIPATPLDIDRVEVVLGPASALYGPNSANGVMHLITTSPIDAPGSAISLSGGTRSIFNGAFRQAFRFSEKAGFKVSGQYFRGDDFEYVDPEEERQRQLNPSNQLIGARNFQSEKWGGEARLDIRPWDGSNDGLSFTYGLNTMVNSVELTGIGAGQAKDWRYQFGQVQFTRSGFYWQAFVNASDAGDTYLLRTGASIVDRSTVLASQAQYAFGVGDAVDLVAGVDVSKTTPKTDGTINGANEDIDETLEIGGYLSATLALADQLDLVGALRVDDHEHLADPVWSPRVGLVLEPVEGHVLRGTFNRAFSTPTSNNLFLDLVAGRIPVGPVTYDIRTSGVPSTGYTWNNQCAGGVMSYCMYSPFAPGTQLPASGAVLWDGVIVPTVLTDATLVATLAALGITPEQFAGIVGGPTPGDIASTLLRFNPEDPVNAPFLPDPGVQPVSAILPTITNTFELGYQGLIADRVKLSASVYRNQIRDFVGPLRVESPSVFLDGPSVATFVATRLAGAGVPGVFAQQIAAGIAGQAARVPLGTVAPDQRSDSDLVLTYRNFGDVNFWGADLGFEAYATDDLAILGSYSWVSKECFDFNDDGDCFSTRDVALNAPTNKGSIGLRYDDRASGIVVSGRLRATEEFPMNSGVYVGKVEGYTVIDANVAYRVPGYEQFIVSATVNNVFDNVHQEFIGAPAMGRIALVKLQYAFGN